MMTLPSLCSPARTADRAAPPPPCARLHAKTTFFLIGLLIVAIAACGLILLTTTASILRENKQKNLRQLAYTLAGPLSNAIDQPGNALERQLQALHDSAQLDFVMVTRPDQQPVAEFSIDPKILAGYRALLQTKAADANAVHQIANSDKRTFIFQVPLFQGTAGHPLTLVGYLHVGMDDADISAQLHYLRACVLLTCLGIVIATIPLAVLISRHITVPIKRLSQIAQCIALGDFSHRAPKMRRDEIGDLAAAFNAMLDKVHAQQSEIRAANADLEAKVLTRTSELEHVNHRLQSEMSEKEDFLRAVSHDLNAPLRNISGMASMLILKYSESLEKDAVQRLERIQKNVEVECELINELLELSRIKTKRERLEEVDLHALVTAIGEQLSNDFETRQIAFAIEGNWPSMRCEKGRMRQVFQNLIDNAIKYMRPDGEKAITLSIVHEAENIVFIVRDTGMGIAAEDLPHVFHVFRRAKNASMLKIPGKGVGLASVKSIIENYGGRITAESTPGVGTEFFVTLPKTYFMFKEQSAEVCV
jgi:signal transduction histidine kinase